MNVCSFPPPSPLELIINQERSAAVLSGAAHVWGESMATAEGSEHTVGEQSAVGGQSPASIIAPSARFHALYYWRERLHSSEDPDHARTLPSISRSQLTLGREIGHGSSVKARICRLAGCPALLVVRTVKGVEDANCLQVRGRAIAARCRSVLKRTIYDLCVVAQDAAREASIWASISHPHCLSLIGICEQMSPREFMFVCEYMPGGTLAHELDRRLSCRVPPLVAKDVCSRMAQIASGMEYLHSISVIHCDLKPSNVLINQADQLVVADFGQVRPPRLHISQARLKISEALMVPTVHSALPDIRRQRPLSCGRMVAGAPH